MKLALFILIVTARLSAHAMTTPPQLKTVSNKGRSREAIVRGIASSGFTIDCNPPSNFAGETASISGNLQVKDEGLEYLIARGNLKIIIGGSTAKPILKRVVKVEGVQLDDGSFNLIDTRQNSPIEMVYLNSVRKDVSYVEINGRQYLSNCSKQ